jgi:hypothetical protein
MADCLRLAMRLFLTSLLIFIIAVYFISKYAWFSKIEHYFSSFKNIKTQVFFSSKFLSFLISFISFLIAGLLESKSDLFITYLKRIFFGLVEVLYSLAHLTIIITIVYCLSITSSSFSSWVGLCFWLSLIRFVWVTYKNFSINKELCFGVIFAVVYFVICHKVCDSIHSFTTTLSTTTDSFQSRYHFKPSPYCPSGNIMIKGKSFKFTMIHNLFFFQGIIMFRRQDIFLLSMAVELSKSKYN